MAGIFAIANHDFDEIFCTIKRFEKRVKINEIQTNVILVSDKLFLTRNLANIQKIINKKTIFVFGSPSYLKEFNLLFIDLNKKCNITILKKCVNNTSPMELHYKPKDEVKKLLKLSKPSVIQNLLTTLYKIQNKHLRESYRNTIFNYLSQSIDDVKILENSLILLSKKKSSNLNELIEIINSEIFRDTHLSVNGQMPKSKIAKFDINYIFSFKNKAGKL